MAILSHRMVANGQDGNELQFENVWQIFSFTFLLLYLR